MAGQGGKRRGFFRTGRRTLLVALAVVVAFALVTARLFVFPARGAPPHVDAIVVLAGDGNTYGTALGLAREGRAPVLVVSTGHLGFGGPCPARTSAAKVICFQPDPANTRGEAQYIGKLTAQHHWNSIVLVTTPTQDTRARLLVKRCFGGSVYVIPGSLPRWSYPYQVAYEWAATAKALTLYRGC